MSTLLTAALYVVAPFLLWKTLCAWKARQNLRPTPPGPSRRWLVGHLFDMPQSHAWETYRDWSLEYGDVVYVELPMRPILILGSYQAAKELLDGRSAIYSDRPSSVMRELVSWGWSMTSMPYGSTWRATRKLFHSHFSGSVVHRYQPIQLQETRALLSRFLDSPDLARQHIHSLPGSTVMRIVYGTRNASQTQEYVQLADRALESARKITVPGAFLVESIPFLRYVPGWMPGGAAQRFAAHYRPIVQQMRNQPFEKVKESIFAGDCLPSIASNIIRQLQGERTISEITTEEDTLARNVTAVAYAGASATTVAALESFMVAMAKFPEVQVKARGELDAFIGSSRLPEFDDLKNLTYIRAIVMETLRWMPSAPLGLPHCLSQDDEYKGYHIPGGSLVFANVWGILHNPNDYPQPEVFWPERYIAHDGQIDSSVRDPCTIAFGFGRRICPGSDYAMNLITICVASILHVFHIEVDVDEFGQPAKLSSQGSSDAISAPTSFPIHLTPHSPEAASLVRDIEVEYEDKCFFMEKSELAD